MDRAMKNSLKVIIFYVVLIAIVLFASSVVFDTVEQEKTLYSAPMAAAAIIRHRETEQEESRLQSHKSRKSKIKFVQNKTSM